MNGLESLNHEPTRIAADSATCIDHVFARIACRYRMLVDVSTIHAGITDHSLLCVRLSLAGGDGEGDEPLPTSQPLRTRVNYDKLRQLLREADWSDVYNDQDPAAISKAVDDRDCVDGDDNICVDSGRQLVVPVWITGCPVTYALLVPFYVL
ncbi:hypothetical protein J6590_059845 [Homalodisca vitripennis]|nr:hypothetical protein J6590_059845 [Homalodisca vitripennis]